MVEFVNHIPIAFRRPLAYLFDFLSEIHIIPINLLVCWDWIDF